MRRNTKQIKAILKSRNTHKYLDLMLQNEEIAFVGIDPGKSGAMAIIYHDEVVVYPNPTTAVEAYAFIKDFQENSRLERGQYICIMENVHSMPRDGSKQAFSFGENKGIMSLIAYTLFARVIFETPATWMKHFKLKKGKTESTTKYKNRLKSLAISFFTNLKVTLKTSDALLIALYTKEKMHYAKHHQSINTDERTKARKVDRARSSTAGKRKPRLRRSRSA
ncbi:RuvC family protein [Flammeovirga agarivorans]|uniref:hypothetical protein n=1 Tax=Flammeovirga agarivorans TaxID=2726742 RepID=UPI001F3C2CBB|nr:hypothetical protein [Flammeovirga agarivorans]